MRITRIDLDEIKKHLIHHDKVHSEPVRVRLSGLGQSGLGLFE